LRQRIKRKVREKAKLRVPKDPVEKGRCAAGTWAYGLLAIAGIVFFFLGATAEPMDVWEMLSAGFLFLQAIYTIIFLGGDPCLIEAFNQALKEFQTENDRLKASNNALEEKLLNLEHVTSGLETVYQQMDNDVEATENMLIDMERYSNLHTATSVVLQFFTCDIDRSGVVKDFEADYFGPQFTRLWELVGPDYDQNKFVEAIRTKGLTLQNLSFILEALVADDKGMCIHELDRLVGDMPAIQEEAPGSPEAQVVGRPQGNPFSPGEDVEAGNPFSPEVRPESTHLALPPRRIALGEAEDTDPDLEAPCPQRGRRLAIEAGHSMIAPSAGSAASNSAAEAEGEKEPSEPPSEHELTPSEQEKKDQEDDAKRCCRCSKKGKRGPLEPCMDLGFMKIYGVRHLLYIIAAAVGLVFLTASFFTLEISNLVCSIVSTSLSVGLMASSRLLYVLEAMKKEIRHFRHENDKLEVLNEELAGKVSRLQRVEKGFEVLKDKCELNTAKGQELIRKSNLNIVSTAHAVVNYLFQRASATKRELQSPQEIDTFVTELDEVFRSVPNFDADRIRAILQEKGGLTIKDLPKFVKMITSVSKPPNGPAGEKGALMSGSSAKNVGTL
jgi:hypothetical protein